MINNWLAFFITIGTETINWLSSMRVLSTPLIGILAGFFLVGFVIRVYIQKA